MPLVSVLGEQSLNAGIEDDKAGRGVFLVDDSDGNLFGIVQEIDGGGRRVYGFFVQGDRGLVTPRYLVGEDITLLIAQYDQDAFVIYAEDRESEAFAPIGLRSDGSAIAYEDDLDELTPSYRITEDGIFTVDGNNPIGGATQVGVEGNLAVVYVADDGDGSGIFLRVTDEDGNVIGGVIRVNADVSGDQVDPIIGRLDEAFTVAWTQARYDGANTEEYRAITYNFSSNLELAVKADAGDDTLAGDAGDYVTDIFFWDTAAGENLGSDTINGFGANDILVTTSAIFDSNGDGIITFGGDRRLDLTDASGTEIGEIAFAGLRSLEFDGAVETITGVTYYVYSRENSAADEFYLIPPEG